MNDTTPQQEPSAPQPEAPFAPTELVIQKRNINDLSIREMTTVFTENSRLMQQAEKGIIKLTLKQLQEVTSQQADIMHRLNHAPKNPTVKAEGIRAKNTAKTKAVVQQVEANDDLGDL